MELINVKDLISELKKKNIDLGKGDPYNRLRYYTKIGWIDHMIRKKDSNGVVVGHYPINVIEKILEIENLKQLGKSNEEITTYIKQKQKNQRINNEQNLLEVVKNKININLIIIILIVCGFIFELNNYNSLNDKLPIIKEQNNLLQMGSKITDMGKNVILSGKNKVFINSKAINQRSTVLVSFEDSIEPATNYFIKEKIEEEGFFIETNISVKKDVNFNWIIIN